MTVHLLEREPSTEQNCPVHGAYVSHVIFGVRAPCRQCARSNFESLRKKDELEALLRVSETYKAHSKIPSKFHGVNPKQTLPPVMEDWLVRYFEDRLDGPLVIVGPLGVGKTYAACAAVLRVCSHYRKAVYVSCFRYCEEIRATWKKQSEHTEVSVLNRYANASFLVLDEVGAGKDADVPILQALICARYEASTLPSTMIISNLAPQNFGSVIGDRAADRIREGSSILTMDGKSRRVPSNSGQTREVVRELSSESSSSQSVRRQPPAPRNHN